MKRSLVVFVALGLLAGLIGCGGSDNPLNIKEQDADRAWLIQDFLDDDSYSVDKEAAECYVDTVAEAANMSYSEIRASAENESADLSEISPEFFAAAMGSFAVCGIELELNWGGGDDSEADDSLANEGELVEKSEAERSTVTVLALGESFQSNFWNWEGLVMSINDIEIAYSGSGEYESAYFKVQVRAENPTSESIYLNDISVHCAEEGKFDLEGSWYATGTYDMYDDLPAGSFHEGELHLTLPEGACNEYWVVIDDGESEYGGAGYIAWIAPEVPAS